MPVKHKFEFSGYEVVEKIVADDNSDSGRIYVPKNWKGKKVVIVRLEE